MKDILKDLGLSLHSLSRKATRTLKDLVKSAKALNTKDTSLTSFFCAINHMTLELVETKSENRDMQWELSNTKRKLMSVLMMEEQILQDIKNLEECQQAERVKIESRSHNLKFLRDKSLELKIRIRRAESIPLARVKIEEEKRKLNALEEELSKELDKLAFELM
ncbi:hypothetical protein WISP_04586 [Willisornis vidua]|uniref:Uncharacterized protein n=1 Tax=Willisornis vidua TaxID=1566151 RepID=A0ABQ9DT81_9PASS|nr:hypothetical protein WISP_04586 [Willisornis vidua]